jgi:hypothetical protein
MLDLLAGLEEDLPAAQLDRLELRPQPLQFVGGQRREEMIGDGNVGGPRGAVLAGWGGSATSLSAARAGGFLRAMTLR